MASSSSSSTYGAADPHAALGAMGGGSSGGALLAPDRHKLLPSDNTAPYIAEFVGTFVLVLTVGCIALSPGHPTWGNAAIGSALMVMIYATGSVSGGNLNPAVSFSLGLIGSLRWVVVVRYWVVQLAAGFAASLALWALYAPRMVTIGPVEPFTWEYAVTAEVIYTFMLCFVVNNCAASKRNNPKDDPNQFYALAIGFVIIAGGYAVGNISGAAFNPAVALALSTGTDFRWGFAWLVAELLGGVLAAIMFRAVRPEEYNPPAGGAGIDYEPRLHSRCASEFLGTFMLVLTVGLNITMGSPASALAAGVALMCMTYSLGNVSGAHFNPAVTLAVVLSGRDKCSAGDGASYMICQTLGGALAGLLYAQFHAAGPNSGLTFGLKPGPGYGPSAAGVVELFFAFVLAYAFLSCATVTPPISLRGRQSFSTALSLGACVTAGGLSAGRVSGGELNPAVTVGVAAANVAHTGWGHPPPPVTWSIILSLWELTGGLLAAVVFSLTHPDEYKKAPLLSK